MACKDAFERELVKRSPLASCVLDTFDHLFDEGLLATIWDEHRGRCYEDVLSFDAMLRLMRDALLRHGGSAHKLFLELESRDAEPCDESNFYRKLSRTPTEISCSLLSRCTQRLSELMPASKVKLPGCLDAFELIVGDGKQIKNVAKRLLPARGLGGKLLGGKALVALNLRSGLAVAMSDALDGMSNDVPLVPFLMPQLHELFPHRPILSVWDRQFDDVRSLRRFCQRPGDSFLVRMKQKQAVFAIESSRESVDARGRRVLDEIGLLGQGKLQMRVRRITLFRDAGQDEEDVVLLTDLLEQNLFPAADLLELYAHRWGIEQVFQQVTQTFSLQHLIGSSPKATILQFGFCLLLYNLMQMIKSYVAEDGGVLASVVSLFYLFDDVRKELEAWAYHTTGQWPRTTRDAEAMREHLRLLLSGSWDPVKYTKASDKKPRGKPQPKRRLHGGHSSMQRALEGRARMAIS